MEMTAQEFIAKAKAEQRKQYEKERDELLISLGITQGAIREYSPDKKYEHPYLKWDKEKKNYYYETLIPAKVTDEEYEEIKALTVQKSVNEQINNRAEMLLKDINIIIGILGVIGAFMAGTKDILTGACILIGTGLTYCTVRVLLNISNNLHRINSKLK